MEVQESKSMDNESKSEFDESFKTCGGQEIHPITPFEDEDTVEYIPKRMATNSIKTITYEELHKRNMLTKGDIQMKHLRVYEDRLRLLKEKEKMTRLLIEKQETIKKMELKAKRDSALIHYLMSNNRILQMKYQLGLMLNNRI